MHKRQAGLVHYREQGKKKGITKMRRGREWAALAAILWVVLPGCSGGKDAGNSASSGTGNAVGGTGNTSSDDQITKAVQDKLDADPTLKTAGIKAKATGGQVSLTGTVKAVADKDKAEADANEAIKPFSSVNAGVVDNITIADSSGGAGGK